MANYNAGNPIASGDSCTVGGPYYAVDISGTLIYVKSNKGRYSSAHIGPDITHLLGCERRSVANVAGRKFTSERPPSRTADHSSAGVIDADTPALLIATRELVSSANFITEATTHGSAIGLMNVG